MTRERYEVDAAMVGDVPGGFDLRAFCERLQDAVPDVEIVSVTDSDNGASNEDPDVVDDATWQRVLDAYCDTLGKARS